MSTPDKSKTEPEKAKVGHEFGDEKGLDISNEKWAEIKGKLKERWDNVTEEEGRKIKAKVSALFKTSSGKAAHVPKDDSVQTVLAPKDDSVQNAEFSIDESLAGLTKDSRTKADIDWHAALRRRFRDLPDDYAAACSEMSAMRHAFFTEMATDLTTRLNLFLRSQPQDSYADKQEIARAVNANLRELGLAIKCPKTGRPATLIADVKNADSPAGRFRLEIRDENGKKTRTWSSQQLPEFELMEDEPRLEPLAKWAEQVRQRKTQPDSSRKK